MLINAENSCLLIVDVQERLMPVVYEGQKVIDNSVWLAGIAERLGIPVLMSEQYPRGLGHTVPQLVERVSIEAIMEKVHFSCALEHSCMERIDACDRPQMILTGAEAHVCVLQTALGLQHTGKEVYVVADAVASRDPHNVELAFERLRAEGVRMVSREMVAFEWLRRAGTDVFRVISREFLK